MNEHRLSITRSARYFTLGELSPGVREVWFVCHGYGQLAPRFIRHFESLQDATRLIVAPEGLSRFYLGTGESRNDKIGASWMTREDRLAEIDDYVRYLDAVRGALPAGRAAVTALGFSQGAATVCRWAAFASSPVDRVIVWGGEVPPDLDLGAEPAATRLRNANLTLVYGTRDEYFTPKIVGATEARLRDHEIPFQTLSYEGGHEIDADVLRRLAGP